MIDQQIAKVGVSCGLRMRLRRLLQHIPINISQGDNFDRRVTGNLPHRRTAHPSKTNAGDLQFFVQSGCPQQRRSGQRRSCQTRGLLQKTRAVR